MTITAEPVPILSDNYAWLLRDSATGAVAIVDPAEPKPIIAALEKAGGRLDLILLTHHHADHVAGADEVRAHFGAKMVGAAADAHRLPKLDVAVQEGDTVQFGAAEARVIDTPGHTIGQINYFFPDGEILLSGDTLFSLGCGRLIEGNADVMFASLRKLAALPRRHQGVLRPRIHREQRAVRAKRRWRQRGAGRTHGAGEAAAGGGRADGAVDDGRRTGRQSVPARAGCRQLREAALRQGRVPRIARREAVLLAGQSRMRARCWPAPSPAASTQRIETRAVQSERVAARAAGAQSAVEGAVPGDR